MPAGKRNREFGKEGNMTWAKSLPGRQGRKNKSCWVLRGEAEEKEGRGGNHVGWSPLSFILPKVGGGERFKITGKVLGRFQSKGYCSSLFWINIGTLLSALR